jgi:UDP-N-acetylglucosamine 4-epimerase
LLAATVPGSGNSEIYNVAVSDATTLNQLFAYLKEILSANGIRVTGNPAYSAFRNGDVKHSQADVSKAMRELGYAPQYRIYDGLEATIPWYVERANRKTPLRAEAGREV